RCRSDQPRLAGGDARGDCDCRLGHRRNHHCSSAPPGTLVLGSPTRGQRAPRGEPVTSAQGLVSRVSPVQTALRNCTRDEGRSFEVGNQVLISSHRKLLLSKRDWKHSYLSTNLPRAMEQIFWTSFLLVIAAFYLSFAAYF